jgi:hypothetical protein
VSIAADATPNNRHEPSSSCTNNGPPESPRHAVLPSSPTTIASAFSSSMLAIVCAVRRLMPWPSAHGCPFATPPALAPNPTIVAAPSTARASASHPIASGTIGSPTTGSASTQYATSWNTCCSAPATNS